MKHTWKKAAAGLLALALAAGAVPVPANIGGFLTGRTGIVASAEEVTVWHIGDGFNLDEKYALPNDQNPGNFYQLTYAGCSVPTPTYEPIYNQWLFDGIMTSTVVGSRRTLLLTMPSDKTASDVPTGFKIKSGEGTSASPYEFELVYDTIPLTAGTDYTAPAAKTGLTCNGSAQELVTPLTWTDGEKGTVYYGIETPFELIAEDNCFLSIDSVKEGQVYKPLGVYGIFFPEDYTMILNGTSYTTDSSTTRINLYPSNGKYYLHYAGGHYSLPSGCNALRITGIDTDAKTITAEEVNAATAGIQWGAANALPTATDAGTYPVYYKITAATGYADVAATKIADVTIAAELSETINTAGSEYTYTGTYGTVTVSSPNSGDGAYVSGSYPYTIESTSDKLISKVELTAGYYIGYTENTTAAPGEVSAENGNSLITISNIHASKVVIGNSHGINVRSAKIYYEDDKTVTLQGASVSLADDLALNFYVDGIADDTAAAEYTLKFEGACVDKTAALSYNATENRYYGTTHVYAKDIDHNVTAALYKGERKLSEHTTNISDYLMTVAFSATVDEKTQTLAMVTRMFGHTSAAYFDPTAENNDESIASNLKFLMGMAQISDEELLKMVAPYALSTDDALLSLVLDSRTAARLYVRGVVAGTEASGYTAAESKFANTKAEFPSYFEVGGLLPQNLADKYTIHVGGTDYRFSALSWCDRVLNSANADLKNINMAKAIALYYRAAKWYTTPAPRTVNLSELTENYEAHDGDVLTGSLAANCKITVADGAAITLRDCTITNLPKDNSCCFAGITCEGDTSITLEGTNAVKGGASSYPGIYIAPDKTLTIGGTGKLEASSNGVGSGIGGGDEISCGNIVINSGDITATGGTMSAAIGSGFGSNCGTITINGGTVTAIAGYRATAIGTGGTSICGDITINGGTVTATGDSGGAGIGSASGNDENNIITKGKCGNITITGGTVTAAGGYGGAGIGSGYNRTSECGNITITGGTVTATGGNLAVGIGSGYSRATCGDITITDGVTKVTAIKGSNATYSIGKTDYCGKITIGGNETGNISESPYIYEP